MLATDGGAIDPRHLQEIKQAIIGPESEQIVRFYEHARRDHRKEQEQQERIKEGSGEVARPFWTSAVYIEKRFKGQIDYIAKPATDQDKRENPREWAAFDANKGKPPKHSVRLLPGNDVCTQAAFDELRIEYIEDFIAFAEAKPEILEIFSELAPLLETAKRWRTFMKPRLKLVDGKVQNGHD